MDRELVQPPPAALKPRLPLTPGVREPTQRRTHDHQPLTCQPKRGNLNARVEADACQFHDPPFSASRARAPAAVGQAVSMVVESWIGSRRPAAGADAACGAASRLARPFVS